MDEQEWPPPAARRPIPIAMGPADIRREVDRINASTAAAHYPDRDGICPVCGVWMCLRWVNTASMLRPEGKLVAPQQPHQPRRPQWDCETDGAQWPCVQARVVLGDIFGDQPGRPGLLILMGGMMISAARERPDIPEDELTERFLAWQR